MPPADVADRLPPAEVAALLAAHGAILFQRRCPTPDDFRDFSAEYGETFSNYRGGALRWGPLDRENVAADPTLLTTTGSNYGFPIPLHGEMYYMSQRPALLWFYCEKAPRPGTGQTILGDGRALWEAFPSSLRAAFERQRISYRRRLGQGEWQRAFLTEDLDEARAVCRDNGTEFAFDEASGVATTEFTCPAVLRREGVAPAFINNLVFIWKAERAFAGGAAVPIVVRWEDGEPIEPAAIQEIERVAEPMTVAVEWEAGDVLLVDNTRTLHGRRDSRGSGRSILVRMGEPRW